MNAPAACAKIAFDTRARAKEAAQVSAKRLNGGQQMHVYQCPQCRCFHVTRMSRRDAKRVRRRA